MIFDGTPRRPARWYHCATELEAFAIVSFRVSTAALASVLPDGVEPRSFDFDDGTSGSLVSAVAFRDRDFHFRFCPPAAFSCGQVNYRAYVTYGDRDGAWFFETSLDHWLVHVPKLLWSMPWRRARIGIAADWSAQATWSLSASDSAHGMATCRLSAGPEEPAETGRLDGFESVEETLRVLTHPIDGWYRHRRGAIGQYSIWHPPMRARGMRVESARFPIFEQLGLTTPETPAHSALVQPRLPFDIHTPPSRVRPRRDART